MACSSSLLDRGSSEGAQEEEEEEEAAVHRQEVEERRQVEKLEELMGLRLITTKEWNTQWCIAQVAS